jgi:L-iditol 2-dehydrogenase
MKSAAVVNFAPEKGSVEIREIEKPTIGAEDVLLEVANVGVCGSDLHQWTSDHSWPVNYPVVLGHEFGAPLVVLGAPLTIDADAFKTADGNLEASLRMICEAVHAQDVPAF